MKVELEKIKIEQNLTDIEDVDGDLLHAGNFDCSSDHYQSRKTVVYCGLLMSFISINLVVLHTLAYRDFLKLVCILAPSDDFSSFCRLR